MVFYTKLVHCFFDNLNNLLKMKTYLKTWLKTYLRPLRVMWKHVLIYTLFMAIIAMILGFRFIDYPYITFVCSLLLGILMAVTYSRRTKHPGDRRNYRRY